MMKFWIVAQFIFVIAMMLVPRGAMALCISAPTPSLRSLQDEVYRNPKSALAQIEARFTPNSPFTDRAWLHAIAASAYGRLERAEDQQREVAAARRYPIPPDSDLEAHLVIQTSQMAGLPDELQHAKALLERTARRHATGSPAWICLRASLGSVDIRSGRIGEGGAIITNAFQSATLHRRDAQRFGIATDVAFALIVSLDFSTALDVIDQADRYAADRGFTMERENLAYFRGNIAMRQSDFEHAVVAFEAARDLATRTGDEQGVAYADLQLCEARLERGQFDQARRACATTRRLFALVHRLPYGRLTWLEARLMIADGHPAGAIARLNSLIGGKNPSSDEFIVTQSHLARAAAFEALGRNGEALRDMRRYMDRREKALEGNRLQAIAAMRARFQTDLREREKVTLEQRLALTNSELERRRLWLWSIGVAAMLISVLLGLVICFGRRHSRTLAAHAAAAREMAQAKADFLSNMSHEIRAPLGSLILNAQMIADSPDMTDRSRAVARRMDRVGQRLIDLLDDLLLFSRIETRHVPLHDAPFDPCRLCLDIVDGVRDRAAGAGIEVHADIDDKVPTTMMGDAGKITQILANLLDNAVLHSQGRTVRLHVAPAGPDALALTVEDDGIGIPESDRERVFQRFLQVDGSRHGHGGSGLGLAISKGLCELMGGSIHVGSAAGRGTRMTVRLPCRPSPSEAPGRESSET